jgi:uncharacterized protein (DUF697 family)
MQTAAGSPFSTAQEMELASRVLEATDVARLRGVLTSLLKQAGDAQGVRLDDATARSLKHKLLDTAIRLGMPQLSRLRLAAVRSPQVTRGMGLLSRASRLLGLELEGLSPEDKEFEVARRFVRLGGAAMRQLRRRPSSGRRGAAIAISRARRAFAPGLAVAIDPPPESTSEPQTSSCACQDNCSCSSCGGAPADISDTSNRSNAMHDIDHTKSEYDELDELDELGNDEMEFSDEYDSGELDEMESDAGEYYSGEYDETGSPFSEVEEAELAQELLGLSSEAELDQFLGKIFKKVWRGASDLAKKAGVARPLGGILKGLAKKLLPVAAGAAGTFFGGPVGAAIGSKIGKAVGNALETEFEGSPEDREFEAAKTFVQVAGKAAQQAGNTPPSTPPVTAAKDAVVSASKDSVKRLRRRRNGSSNYSGGHSASGRRTGRWVRRGNRIILFGV